MTRGKRRIKDWVWVVLFFGVFIAYGLIADWWKDNSVVGWIILGIFGLSFLFALYRFVSFRGWLFRSVANVSKSAIYEGLSQEREAIPIRKREKVLARANNLCENPDCKYRRKPHIHHISMNSSDNDLRNLAVLCPNCHSGAHSGEYTNSQLRNWINRNYQLSKKR